MFDSIYAVQRFEHERSQNLNLCIRYEKASMAAQCLALDELAHEYFLHCQIATLAKTKSPKTTANAHQRLKRTLRSLFWNLVRAARVNDDCYLKIPMGDNHYRARADDNPHQITRTALCPIIKRLEECGYLQRHCGFLDGQTGKARFTRIRPSLALLEDLNRHSPSGLPLDFKIA